MNSLLQFTIVNKTRKEWDAIQPSNQVHTSGADTDLLTPGGIRFHITVFDSWHDVLGNVCMIN